MNKAITWIKQHRVKSSILGVLLISFVWFTPFFKATDPTSPFFIESLFRLRDYNSNVDMLRYKVIPVLFPVGTPKKYVDLMLGERGGAEIVDQTEYEVGKYMYVYQPPSLWLTPDAWFIPVYYDEELNVEAIGGGSVFFVGKGYEPQNLGRTK